jgi:hypothetical protein
VELKRASRTRALRKSTLSLRSTAFRKFAACSVSSKVSLLEQPRERSRESPRCQPGSRADRQPRRPARDLASAPRHAAHFRHRRHRPPTRSGCGPLAASDVGRDAVEAVVAARTAPGQIAALIVPADMAWSEGGSIAARPFLPKPPLPSAETVEKAAAMLQSGLRTAILMTGNALFGKGLIKPDASHQLPEPNCSLLSAHSIATRRRNPTGRSCAVCSRTRDRAVQGISSIDSGGRSGSSRILRLPGKESGFTSPDCAIHTLASPGEDHIGALDALAAALPVRVTDLSAEQAERPALPSGEITLPRIGCGNRCTPAGKHYRRR